jgi:large subunit ribosomal protein L17
MLANMACSLIEHKRINTTVAKAKALKQFVEPLITKSKADTLTIVVLFFATYVVNML